MHIRSRNCGGGSDVSVHFTPNLGTCPRSLPRSTSLIRLLNKALTLSKLLMLEKNNNIFWTQAVQLSNKSPVLIINHTLYKLLLLRIALLTDIVYCDVVVFLYTNVHFSCLAFVSSVNERFSIDRTRSSGKVAWLERCECGNSYITAVR